MYMYINMYIFVYCYTCKYLNIRPSGKRVLFSYSPSAQGVTISTQPD